MKREIIAIVLFVSVFLGVCSSEQIFGYTVGDNELLFFPTTETMPAGSITISNMELGYFNLSVGISDTTQIGVSSWLIPPSMIGGSLVVSVRQQIVTEGKIKVTGWLSAHPVMSLVAVGGVAGIGNRDTNVFFGAGLFGSFKDLKDFRIFRDNFFMVGIRQRIYKKSYFIAEYYNQFQFKFTGIILAGLRLQLKKLSFDLGGIYTGLPTFDGDGFLFPYLKVSFLIK